jgi:hypothetical protein
MHPRGPGPGPRSSKPLSSQEVHSISVPPHYNLQLACSLPNKQRTLTGANRSRSLPTNEGAKLGKPRYAQARILALAGGRLPCSLEGCPTCANNAPGINECFCMFSSSRFPAFLPFMLGRVGHVYEKGWLPSSQAPQCNLLRQAP